MATGGYEDVGASEIGVDDVDRMQILQSGGDFRHLSKITQSDSVDLVKEKAVTDELLAVGFGMASEIFGKRPIVHKRSNDRHLGAIRPEHYAKERKYVWMP